MVNTVFGAALLLAGALLVGCPPPGAPASQPTPEGTAPRVSPRVVTGSAALAEMICALDAREHLVGVSRFCTYPKELQRLPRIGGAIDPNLEAIDALEPDLVLTQGQIANLVALAERRPFEVIDFQIEALPDVFEALDQLGRLLGRPAEAARERKRLEAAFAKQRADLLEIRPRVLLVFNHKPGGLGQVYSPGTGTFVSQCLEAAGGDNCLVDLSASGWHTVAKEVLLDKAPDLIIELNTEPVSDETARLLRDDWQVLDSIPAVKNGRVAIVSGSEVLLPATRLPVLLAKLARAVRGELDVR